MRTTRILSIATMLAGSLITFAAGGCAVDSDTVSQGNASLGIARFSVQESSDRTMLVAFDANGSEVGHLDLVHGTFSAMPEFADDFLTPTVDGRSLEVVIDGQSTRWQTAGYEPVLSLPAISPKAAKLGHFLEDPHVAEVLERWQIGFEPFHDAIGSSLEGEEGYLRSWSTRRSYNGTSGFGCTGCTDLGTVNSPARTINTCGNQVAAVQAAKINVGTQWWVLQKCPANPGNNLFEKSCPYSGDTSTCGTAIGGACKGCPLVAWALGGIEEDDVRVVWTTTNIHGDYGSYYFDYGNK